MYVCSHAWALLQYMLPHAFRRRIDMHGDFTGGVGSIVLAWLGLASSGVGLRRTDTGDRLHLDGI